MIQPSHPVPPSAGTGPFGVVTPTKATLQHAHSYSKMTVPTRQQHTQLGRSTLIRSVNFLRQSTG